MLLRSDYLQNKYSRLVANRRILNRIAREKSNDKKSLEVITNRLEQNLSDLQEVEKAMKLINQKPIRK